MKNNPSGMDVKYTTIPFAQAYTIRQTASGKVEHTETASENIGFVTLSNQASAIGTIQEFALNPSLYGGTRLAQLSSIFQKFKFLKADLVVATNQPATTGGQFVVGYTNQPEQEFSPGQNTLSTIYALPGGEYVQTFVPTTIRSVLDSKQPNLFIDDEGNEKNTTQQGKFVIGVQSPTTAASIQTFPVILNYTIRFSDAAVSKVTPSPTLAFPATGIALSNLATGQVGLLISTGETLAFPTMTANILYSLNPRTELQVVEAGSIEGSVEAGYISWLGTSTSGRLDVKFYHSQRDFEQNQPLLNLGDATMTGPPNQMLPRFAITAGN